MSLTSGPISEAEQATEHVLQQAAKDSPATAAAIVESILSVLQKLDLVIRISLEPKP